VVLYDAISVRFPNFYTHLLSFSPIAIFFAAHAPRLCTVYCGQGAQSNKGLNSTSGSWLRRRLLKSSRTPSSEDAILEYSLGLSAQKTVASHSPICSCNQH
jgi:hypothetical protein